MNAPCVGCGHPDAAVRSNGLTGVTYTECPVCRGAFVIPRRAPTEADAIDLEAFRRAHMGRKIGESTQVGGKPRHGSVATYRHHGCRCQKCRRAHADAARSYARRRGGSYMKNTAHEAQEKAS